MVSKTYINVNGENMTGRRIGILTKSAALLLGGVCLMTAGCFKEAPSEAPKEPQKRVVTGHGGVPVSAVPEKNAPQGTIKSLKENRLVEHPQRSIGEAFDSYQYFDKKEWRETRSEVGKIYVDFTGLKPVGSIFGKDDENLASRGIGVKFVIYLNGKFTVAMISKLEVMKDGKINATPLENKKQILDAIYANTEITF